MTSQAQDVLNFDFDPNGLETPGKDSRFILKVPGPDKPLICKIIPDPTYANGKSWYRPLKQFPFMVGPNKDTDTRQKTCMSFFGERSPENDAYWEYKKALSALKKAGKGNSTDATKLQTIVDRFYPKEGAWLLIIEPESAVIKALKVPQSVLQLLTGKDATETKPAIPSLIKTLESEGLSPFDVRRQKPTLGWIKIYKTGEKLATRYHVVPCTREIEVEHQGRKIRATEQHPYNVHEKILIPGQLTRADLPNVVEFERKFAWTVDECDAFVKSVGTVVPERFLKRGRQQEGRVDETDEAAPTGSAPVLVSSLDDLPLPGSAVPTIANIDDIPF
jgi:hypothetical protein